MAKKGLRPFIGILFKVGHILHLYLVLKTFNNGYGVNFIKIDKEKLGAVNFNNMIPVIKESYHVFNIDNRRYPL